jgi:nucleoside-diphosphate-sugar epimerase
VNQKNPQNSFLDQCDQVVIYGANGWMGRSAVDFISLRNPDVKKERILLIGSKNGTLEMNNSKFEILDPVTGFKSIRKNSIFFNAAFLRREFLQKMTPLHYAKKNEEVIALAKSAIKNKRLRSFVNLSSGAARDLEKESRPRAVDEYSRLKKTLEVEYSQVCSRSETSIVNCRIFNLSGKHLNEFENLALSSFIKQAQNHNRIEVKSPSTKRTFVDATGLAGTLLRVANQGESASFDSGGVLVTMLELAQNVAKVASNDQCKISIGKEESLDYFGNFQEFNCLAESFGQHPLGIQDQILNTLEAFR